MHNQHLKWLAPAALLILALPIGISLLGAKFVLFWICMTAYLGWTTLHAIADREANRTIWVDHRPRRHR